MFTGFTGSDLNRVLVWDSWLLALRQCINAWTLAGWLPDSLSLIWWSHVLLGRHAGRGWRTAWKSLRSSPARSGSWKVGASRLNPHATTAGALVLCCCLLPRFFRTFTLLVFGVAGAFTLFFTSPWCPNASEMVADGGVSSCRAPNQRVLQYKEQTAA